MFSPCSKQVHCVGKLENCTYCKYNVHSESERCNYINQSLSNSNLIQLDGNVSVSVSECLSQSDGDSSSISCNSDSDSDSSVYATDDEVEPTTTPANFSQVNSVQPVQLEVKTSSKTVSS